MVTTKKSTPKVAKDRSPAGGEKQLAGSGAGAAVVTADRRASRDRRGNSDRRKQHRPVGVERRQSERRKVHRRRQIDPTTCERDYTHDEIEFMNALDEYKRQNGRMFPTCSEVLEVIRKLGYEKPARTEAAGPPTSDSTASAETDSV